MFDAPGTGTHEYQICPTSLGLDMDLPMCFLLCSGISGSTGDQMMSEGFWLGLGLLPMDA